MDGLSYYFLIIVDVLVRCQEDKKPSGVWFNYVLDVHLSYIILISADCRRYGYKLVIRIMRSRDEHSILLTWIPYLKWLGYKLVIRIMRSCDEHSILLTWILYLK